MIERDLDSATSQGRYILRPHRSATWSDNLLLVATVALVALPMAIGWALVGLWPILPLCGGELLLLTLGLYWVNHGLLAQEVITIDAESVTIEAGRRRIERRFDFQRYWSRIALVPPQKRYHPRRLIMKSHGKAVELGRFLTDDERVELADDLRQVLKQSPG